MKLSVFIPLTALLSFAVGEDPNNPQNMTPCLVRVSDILSPPIVDELTE
jgi:hypothetical protein